MKVQTPDGVVHDLSDLRANEVARFIHANDAVPVVDEPKVEKRPAKPGKAEKRGGK